MMKYCNTCTYCVGRTHIHVKNLYYFCKLTGDIKNLSDKCDKHKEKKI